MTSQPIYGEKALGDSLDDLLRALEGQGLEGLVELPEEDGACPDGNEVMPPWLTKRTANPRPIRTLVTLATTARECTQCLDTHSTSRWNKPKKPRRWRSRCRLSTAST